ncbi:MAG: patatin-like phospholipase family protein [Acidobacteriia bacterium]|nr:patatin-like phospholipase family protein [Terriglobia bacterium]
MGQLAAALMSLSAAASAGGPFAQGPPERLLDTITAERIEPDGRFSPYPRWTAPGRPTLALALSGGGARGLAHLGVLESLHEDGVEFDGIAGTSIGALTGAFVCAGYSPEEIEEILKRRDWGAIIAGLDVRRRVLSESEDIEQRSALLKLQFRRRRLLEVGAITESRLLERELYRYLLRAQLESGGDFDRLLYRFRPVAGNILTGERVAPLSGDLVAYVRASFAVPGFFEPVRVGGALLVDGGVVENIPVDTARSLGPSAVVAVDVSEGIPRADYLRGALDNLYRWISVLMADQGNESLSRADLTLTPAVLDITRLDFATNVDRLVGLGREAYRSGREALWALLEARSRDRAPVDFAGIEVAGTSWITPDGIAERLGGARRTVTRYRIAAELARALNLGPFESGRVEWIETALGRRIRFVFRENPVARSVELVGDRVPLPRDARLPLPIDRPFSWEEAARACREFRTSLVEDGRVLAALGDARFDGSTGTAAVRVSDLPIGRIRTEVEGEIRLERTQRFFEDLQDKRFSFDRLADRLDEMVARRAIFEWSLEPTLREDGRADLALHVRGDDFFEAAVGASYRGAVGWGGWARAAKANLTGRGDFVDVTAGAAEDVRALSVRYRTEYGAGFQNLGADVGGTLFTARSPVADLDQRLVDSLAEPWRGERLWATLIHRVRWGASLQAGFRWERDRLDATASAPLEEVSRTSAVLSLGLDRHDRLLFPTRGGAFRLSAERSIEGDELWKAEARADREISLGASRRHTLTGRLGLGLSDGTGRRPFWFNPGGYRDLYGFVPYGAAAPDYARAGATWRLRWLDVGAARLYLEAGADAIRTASSRGGLRGGDTAYGCGASVIVHTRFLGPIAVGFGRNDRGAVTGFITAGYSFVPE